MTYETRTHTGRSRQIPLERLEDVELVLEDERGEPCAGWHYVLVASDGARHEGELDSDGRARVQGVPRGTCTVSVTPEPVPTSAPPAPPAPPPPELPPPELGNAAKRRRGQPVEASSDA